MFKSWFPGVGGCNVNIGINGEICANIFFLKPVTTKGKLFLHKNVKRKNKGLFKKQGLIYLIVKIFAFVTCTIKLIWSIVAIVAQVNDVTFGPLFLNNL